ncbi:MAG: cytochrome c [Gemmatimonadales bacterium]|nr:cytochrome c [Gemmatimonadales bacterium]
MSTRIRLALALAPFVLFAAGCGSGEKAQPQPAADPAAAPVAAVSDAPDPAVMAAGQEGYAICQTCHQAEGQGVPGTYPPLAGSEYATGPADRMIAIVLHGMTGPITVNGQTYNNVMAPWGALADDQLAATITYVRNSFGNKASAVTAADVAAVRQATASRTTAWTVAELEAATLR